eukprot:TRINITY_DN5982_c0_g1_i3.p1 TRINITY_DN5982_c0_g1~~TRINITY_DN5982_c0_g1_i3.p1  ORF type:complete len:696 (+),score=120.04 TRINITY_DN5982_c0_g1_i3:185-2272(+)
MDEADGPPARAQPVAPRPASTTVTVSLPHRLSATDDDIPPSPDGPPPFVPEGLMPPPPPLLTVPEAAPVSTSPQPTAPSSQPPLVAGAPPVAPEKPDQWREVLDKRSGKVYFYNRRTRKTTWQRPVALGGSADPDKEVDRPQYGEAVDPTTGRLYYFNKKTKEVTWTRPAEHQPAEQHSRSRSDSDIDKRKARVMPVPGRTPHNNNSWGAPPSIPPPVPEVPGTLEPPMPLGKLRPVPVPPRVESPNVALPPNPALPPRPASKSKAVPPPKKPASSPAFITAGRHPQMPHDLLEDIHKFQLEAYARKYFQDHHKGLRRKRVPVQELLTFSREPLNKSLLSLSKDAQRDALILNKYIMGYMGDYPMEKLRETRDGIAFTIITRGMGMLEMRDEIFVQIFRQVTGNPSRESEEMGWVLLCLLVACFPPTTDLQQYMISLLHQVSQAQGPVRRYAAYALRRLLETLNGHTSVPRSPEELERLRLCFLNPSPFGFTLEELVFKDRQFKSDVEIPIVLQVMTDTILRLNGPETEGIFRVPGHEDGIKALRAQFDTGNYDMSHVSDMHVAAGLLKYWLRHMRESVFPFSEFERCMSVASNSAGALQVIGSLPHTNRQVLEHLFRFFAPFLARRGVNKMTPHNLAVVFAPDLLRSADRDDRRALLNAEKGQRFLETLLTHWTPQPCVHWLFLLPAEQKELLQ